MRKIVVIALVFNSTTAALYSLCAGRVDLPFAWCYFASHTIFGLGTVAIADRWSPGFALQRLKPAAAEQDRIFKPAGSVSTLAVLVTAGLDAGRLHWRPVVGWSAQLAGFLLILRAS